MDDLEALILNENGAAEQYASDVTDVMVRLDTAETYLPANR